MSTRLLTLVVWLLVAASGTFWTLQGLARPSALPEKARTAPPPQAAGGSLERVLGAPPVASAEDEDDEEAPPPAASRFQLLGVVAPPGGAARQGGLALIALDGKPARPWRTGAAITPEWRLESVSPRSVVLAPAKGEGAPITLNLPDPAAARQAAANAGNVAANRPGGVAGRVNPPPGQPPGLGQPGQMPRPAQPPAPDPEDDEE